jgi:hypothetical protein
MIDGRRCVSANGVEQKIKGQQFKDAQDSSDDEDNFGEFQSSFLVSQIGNDDDAQ